ncbi:MAG: hypothetical protein ACI8YQ_001337 [Polaribacter sp.]|jgi:hypothetical protein
MLKLYKEIEEQLHYWETWESGKDSGVIHKGTIGDRGKDKDIKTDYRNFIDKEIERLVKEGYDAIPLEEHDTLLVEFKIEGNGSKADMERREKLQELIDHALGWTGLGHCEGGTEGDGTMEVVCKVVDFSFASAYIKAGLDGSEFKDYSRVYKEEK